VSNITSRTVERRSGQDENEIINSLQEVISGLAFKEAESVVGIIFSDVSVVDGIHSHSLSVDVVFRSGGLVGGIVEDVISVRNKADITGNKITGFIHIEPDTRERNFVVEEIQTDFPEHRGVGVEPIRIVDISGPNLSQEVSAVGNLDVNIVGKTNIVDGVVDGNTSIDNGNPSLLVFSEHGSHGLGREVVVINGKVNVALHVINIRPHNIKGKGVLAVISKNLFKFKNILVSPFALVETKRPEGLQSPTSQIAVVLLHNSFRGVLNITSQEEVQVNDTSHNLVGQVLATFKDQIHTDRGSKESHTESIGFFSQEIDGVISVGTVTRFTSFNIKRRILGQDTVSAIRAEVHLVVSFSETKDVGSGQCGGELHIIVTVDQVSD